MDWYIVIVSSFCVAVLFLAQPIAYRLGLAFSRGFHRGKRESVKQILNDELPKNTRDELACYHASKRKDCWFYKNGSCECDYPIEEIKHVEK